MADFSLRSTLSATDGTAPSIQSSASSMMKMYDKSPSLAVAEWRNVLQTCSDSQLLPLLYVANEVLQISKRNRGNKYLESFSPILGGSLKLICERDPSVTEKVRRTAKIWGDRRIFSTRFVGELLAGVESYRNGKNASMSSPVKQIEKPNFSPQWNDSSQLQQLPETQQVNEGPNDNDSIQLNNDLSNGDDEGSDEYDDPFSNSGPSLLDVSNFSVDKQALQRNATKGMKRRRASLKDEEESKNKKSSQKQSKRKTALTTSSLVELVEKLRHFDAESRDISRNLTSITSSEMYKSTDEVNEVGDELIDLHAQINSMILDVKKQGKYLWKIAEGKRNTEKEFKRYLLWMKAGLNIDENEIKFCDELERKLSLLQLVHGKFCF